MAPAAVAGRKDSKEALWEKLREAQERTRLIMAEVAQAEENSARTRIRLEQASAGRIEGMGGCGGDGYS